MCRPTIFHTDKEQVVYFVYYSCIVPLDNEPLYYAHASVTEAYTTLENTFAGMRLGF